MWTSEREGAVELMGSAGGGKTERWNCGNKRGEGGARDKTLPWGGSKCSRGREGKNRGVRGQRLFSARYSMCHLFQPPLISA